MSDDISLSGGDSLLDPSEGVAGEADSLIGLHPSQDPIGIVDDVVAWFPREPCEDEHQHHENDKRRPQRRQERAEIHGAVSAQLKKKR